MFDLVMDAEVSFADVGSNRFKINSRCYRLGSLLFSLTIYKYNCTILRQ